MEDTILEISESKLKEWHNNWLLWPTSRLDECLYAVTEPGTLRSQLQRVSRYELSPDQLERIKKQGPEANHLCVHFCARERPDRNPAQTRSTPIFVPVIELVGKKIFLAMQWQSKIFKSHQDGTERIALATADLFCHGFCQLPAYELGAIFEANIETTVVRANNAAFYTYTKEDISDEEKIEEEIRELLPKVEAVYFDLGIAAPIPDHPYPFRPILRLETPKTEFFKKQGDNNNSNVYDVAVICPPVC
ncbi:MAG: hypothetical protein AAFY36_15195 [Bacteroidota bacterium]